MGRLNDLQGKYNKKTLSDDEKEEFAKLLGIRPDELDQPNDGDAPEGGKANKDFKEDVKGSSNRQLKDMLDDEDLSDTQKNQVIGEIARRAREDMPPDEKRELNKLLTKYLNGDLDDDERKRLAEMLGIKPGDLKQPECKAPEKGKKENCPPEDGKGKGEGSKSTRAARGQGCNPSDMSNRSAPITSNAFCAVGWISGG